ncbi:MAG: ABC transporter permease [Thermoanaerobaculia bacterium]
MRGFGAVLRKEWIQMLRDRGTLMMALLIPVFELVLFGVIDNNVKHVRTAVFDQSKTRESRELVTSLVNTVYFRVVEESPSRAALREAIVAGRASVGIEIPPDYARRRLRRQPADFLVLIDGSDSSISSQTLAAVNGVALERSLAEIARSSGIRDLPLEAHPLLLFNPDSRSANLLIPGLIAILLTMSGTVLAAFGIVRERERGTLEQLMVTPASPVGVVLGKLLPYMALGFVQLISILVVMVTVFRVPIHGSLPLFFGLSTIYLLSLLALGLVISSRAKTQMEAIQFAQGFLLPSILLSGYVFPLFSLPGPLRAFANLLPATHFIKISRGIIIRGAGFLDLWPNVAALLAIDAVLILASTRAFKKTIS